MLDYKKIIEIINSLGIKTFTFDYSIYNSYIQGCYEWYKGECPSFHTIKQYNGKYDITIKKAKLHMAKRVSEDLASLVCNENMTINIEDNAIRDYLLGNDEMTGVLGQNDFWSEFNKNYELTAALGTAGIEVVAEDMLKVGDKLVKTEASKVKIARYNALNIIPLSWEQNGRVTEVCFLDEYRIKEESFVELRLHILNESGNYVIVNKKCKLMNTNIKEGVNSFIFLDDEAVIEEFDTGSNIPWFTITKMPQLNSYDVKSPMGASAYGDAIDELKAVDDAFNTLCGEFRYSGKKVFYNKSLLNRDQKGNIIIPDSDESNKQVFYYTGEDFSNNENAEPIHEYNPTIRTKELTDGIELVLDILSFKVGLGHGYYKFSTNGVQKTATEVVSSNSDLYRNVCKMQLAIEKNIYEIIKSVLYASNYVLGTSFNLDSKMAVDFDASLIEDKAKERERALEEVRLGLMTVNEYRAKYYPELGDILIKSEPTTLTE